MLERFSLHRLNLSARFAAARVGVRNARAWVLKLWRNPQRRERLEARATFAFIAAFTIFSVDYLITGGPDWNPGGEAYAMEMVSPTRAPTYWPEALPVEPLPEREAEIVAAVDYSFTSEVLLGGPQATLADATLAESAGPKTFMLASATSRTKDE